MLWGLLLYVASARRGVLRWVAAALFVALATLSLGGQIYFHRAVLHVPEPRRDALRHLAVGERLRPAPRRRAELPLLHRAAARLRASRWCGSAAPGPPAPARSRRASARLLMPAAVRGGLPHPLLVPHGAGLDARRHLLPRHRRPHQAARRRAHARRRSGPGCARRPRLPRRHAAARRPWAQRGLHPHRERPLRRALLRARRAAAPTRPRSTPRRPDRRPLLQMRSNSSTTAIQLAVLWSGLQPTATREALHTAPLLFDYAHAAGVDDAYWTSHHMMFANSRLYVQDLPTSHQCGATDLDPLADIDLGGPDELLTARVEAELPTMREPFFGVVHYGNTHAPVPRRPDGVALPARVREQGPGGRRGVPELLPERGLPPGPDHRRDDPLHPQRSPSARARSSSSPPTTARPSTSTGRSGTPARSSTRRSTSPSGSTRRRARSPTPRPRRSTPRATRSPSTPT